MLMPKLFIQSDVGYSLNKNQMKQSCITIVIIVS